MRSPIAWMPAASVFFRDPDGHLLEYIALIPHEPRPEYGIVPWRTWERLIIWFVIGILVYFFYGVRRSKMAQPRV